RAPQIRDISKRPAPIRPAAPEVYATIVRGSGEDGAYDVHEAVDPLTRGQLGGCHQQRVSERGIQSSQIVATNDTRCQQRCIDLRRGYRGRKREFIEEFPAVENRDTRN